MNFGEKIKELRIKNKLTQQDFADKFFVTRQAVSRWEQGKSIPSIDVIELIAKEFDVSIDYLVSDEDELEKKEVFQINEFDDASYNVYNATSYTIQAYYDDGNKLLFNFHLDSTYSRCKTNVYLPSDNILRKICLELY